VKSEVDAAIVELRPGVADGPAGVGGSAATAI
jgi:hypothetical protein